MHASIVICTWNRAELLDQTLGRLCQLQVSSDIDWELVVVNNNSTDETGAVLGRYRDRLPLRTLFQAKPGKSHAVNLALAHTRGELLLWTDDDVLVDPAWLMAHVNASRTYPHAAFFGGPIDPWFCREPPRWVAANLHTLRSSFAVRDLGESTKPIERHADLPYGANMAIRRKFVEGRQFNVRLGPCEHSQVRGEESEFLGQLLDLGYLGMWIPGARVDHYIPAERLTRWFCWKYYFGEGRKDVRRCGAAGRQFLGAPLWLYRQYLAAMWRFGRYQLAQNLLWVPNLQQMAKSAGAIAESRAMARAK